jgi:hypothetical protein
MEHPNKKQREAQAKLLKELPKNEREEHARLFRFGNAAYIYHEQAETLNPTETDFQEWLIALPKEVRKDMKMMGFELSKGVISFKRYVMEKNDIGMDEWMKNNLSEDDYKEYCKLIESRENLN